MNTPASHARAIFLEALEQSDASERAKFIARACGGDADLLGRVERLMRSHEELGSFHDESPVETIDHPPPERSGTQIGPYKLLQQIGEGGMGVVYMAEQHEPVKRRVALKIIKPGMDTRQVIARFEAERQALSLMDHPNIAKVLDAGTTDSGRPYFVMELVKGQPITQYCDEHHLTPRQRLELLLPVCQAIQHAHQKGIIHRDIKPTNILVAEYDHQPVPKVIDFGVAKATSQALTEKTMFTGFGQIVGTLEYMSPEQAKVNQLDIDTRSDIYSLGVLLYELLTGSTPFDRQRLRSAAFDEMLRIIREEEPEKPSTRLSESRSHEPRRIGVANAVGNPGSAEPAGSTLASIAALRSTEPARLSKLVRGELDWIVMKALEKDRNRRYETANGFAADVQRYLADEPVLACPPSAVYRLRKFARRNKTGLGVAGLLLFILVLLVGSAGWIVRDREARRTKIAGQLELIFQEVEQRQLEQRWPEALAAARRAETLVAGGEGDSELRHQVAEMLAELKLIEHLEDLRLKREVRGKASSDYDRADGQYAAAFREYGLDLDRVPAQQAVKHLRARPHLAAALAPVLDDWTFCRTKQVDAAGAKALGSVVRGIDTDSWRQQVRDAWAQDRVFQLEGLAASPELLRQPPATSCLLGVVLCQDGRVRAGTAVLLKAQAQHPADFWLNYQLGYWLQELRPVPWDQALGFTRAALALRPHSAGTWNSLGYYLNHQTPKRQDEALACFRKAIELDPKFALACSNVANNLNDRKRFEEALPWCRKALELDPQLALAHNSLGEALAGQKKLDEAVACYRKAIELDPKYAGAYNNLGRALAHQNRQEASDYLRKASEVDPPDAITCVRLGIDMMAQKKLDEAIARFRQGIECDPSYYYAYYSLGNALKKQGKLEEAIACLRKAVDLDPKFTLGLDSLARLLATCPDPQLREPKEAVALATRAVELAPNDRLWWITLGRAHYRAGDWKACIEAVDESIELSKSPHVMGIVGEFYLAMAHWQLDHKEEAQRWYQRALESMDQNQPNLVELPLLQAEAAALLKINERSEK